MTSQYIAKQAEFIKSEEERQANLQNVLKYCWALSEQDLPSLPMMNVIGSHDVQHFKTAMAQFFHEISNRCRVEDSSVVLDLGCGCGRLAYPYAKLLTAGRYIGFDVWKEGIDWCSGTFGKGHSNCEFHTVEARNNYYFDERDEALANSFNLQPISNESVDVVFSISVFTHLVRADCAAYLKEIARVLKKDGRAFITGFIIDRFFRAYVEATGNHKGVKLSNEDGCYYAYKGQDFFAGYSRVTWVEMFDSAGLEIVSSEPGSWAQKPGARSFQDTFVAVKK